MKVLKHKPRLEVGLFKQRCEQKQKIKIVIMVDFLVKSVQAKIDSYRMTASSKADGGRISVGYHQTISGRGIGR